MVLLGTSTSKPTAARRISGTVRDLTSLRRLASGEHGADAEPAGLPVDGSVGLQGGVSPYEGDGSSKQDENSSAAVRATCNKDSKLFKHSVNMKMDFLV